MKFKMEVNMDNAAFSDDPAIELQIILECIGDKIRGNGQRSGTVFDTNGNSVGKWEISK